MIPNARPTLYPGTLGAVGKVLKSGWLGMGPQVARFEELLSERFGGRETVAVNSGTAALHLALLSHEVGVGDEVIVPSLTFCASVQAIIACGATPVFAEVDRNTLCLDPGDVERRLTSRTKAVMAVHYGGQPCDLDAILDIANSSGATLIEDAAHAFGSTYRGRLIGSLGDATCFSFDPIKSVTCGEGGAILVRDPEVASRIRRIRALGIDSDSFRRSARGRLDYEVATAGYRYHMSDINAAIGIVQMQHFEEIAARRRRLWATYRDALAGADGLSCLHHSIDEIVPFTFVVRVLHGRRDRAAERLLACDIGVGVPYPPNHLQPFFARFRRPLPVTETVSREILSLPFFPSLRIDVAKRIARQVRTAVAEAGHAPE